MLVYTILNNRSINKLGIIVNTKNERRLITNIYGHPESKVGLVVVCVLGIRVRRLLVYMSSRARTFIWVKRVIFSRPS